MPKKWVKPNSPYATGSSARVTRAVRTDNAKATQKANTEQKKANPSGTKGGYGKKR